MELNIASKNVIGHKFYHKSYLSRLQYISTPRPVKDISRLINFSFSSSVFASDDPLFQVPRRITWQISSLSSWMTRFSFLFKALGGKEWGGGTYPLIDLLKRRQKIGLAMTQFGTIAGNSKAILRPAEAQDVDAIANLGATTFASTFGHSLPASDLQVYLETAYSPSSIANDLANPLMDIIVACDDRVRVVGFAQLTQGTSDPCLAELPSPIELQRLYVDKEFHGSGIGRALMKHVENISKERGFRTIWLGVWEENIQAQIAYKRFGFVKVGSHAFVMGKCVQTDWILTKGL